jgi:sulfur-carrier protein
MSATRPIRLIYFAWVRERIGRPEEERALPSHVKTVSDLMGWLKAEGENYAHAFENGPLIRAALDRTHVSHDTMIGEAREIAFFPPMTGG